MDTKNEMRKRKNRDCIDDFDDKRLDLSLSLPSSTPNKQPQPFLEPLQTQEQQQPQPQLVVSPSTLQPMQLLMVEPSPPPQQQQYASYPVSHQDEQLILSRQQNYNPPQRKSRTARRLTPHDETVDIVPAPFRWATTKHATVFSLQDLLAMGIHTIWGDAECKKCQHKCRIEFDLMNKFMEVGKYISARKGYFNDRAPKNWMNPELPSCPSCNQVNSMRPNIPQDKKMINWLFLLLGQMLGCCTLEQLKYFCKHTRNHRTGAKDRVLYYTYLALCKQLDSTGPFEPAK
ncbi:hypothetical protein GIB67_005473 [Kingdonia uniflora]|uniref:DUF7086 domain-containing protein n=1 Tax=Kingdonia uniflora TaxID=39325 RepID=A0A7J7NH89_9MAGN|nr:hypothetical protein GIB67_005473 [Kingdonia uniflora]